MEGGQGNLAERCGCGALVLAALLSACTTTPVGGQGAVRGLADAAVVVVPEGRGPFPVVLAFHGCGGNGPVQGTYADVALDLGVMAVIVDSFGPRNISHGEALATVCSGLRLRGQERAGDVVAAVEYARAHPKADGEHMVLLGWSHGAWSIMDALAMHLEADMPPGLESIPADPMAGVRGVVLLYPYCGAFSLTRKRGWVTNVPAQFILAADDNVVGIEDCILAAETLIDQGLNIDLQIIPGQTHSFDEPDQSPDGAFRYDPRAAARSKTLFAQFLREHLRLVDPNTRPGVPRI